LLDPFASECFLHTGHGFRRRDCRGFSFVELLVSIVIAGIAFAALVPVFVGAQQKASGDQMRNTALNIAQDRIEKVRALSYNQIVADKNNPTSTPNLYNPTYMGGQFGPSYTATSGTGSTKVFTVDYTVTEVGSGLTAYKKVDVDVFWSGSPLPVKHARLTTMVSKQYAGPQITNLALSPTNLLGQVTGKPVVMTVTISPADIASMAVNGALKGKVIFYVFSAVNGTQIATYTVKTGDAGNAVAGTYTASWDAATAGDGDYSFRAQAFNNASATTPDPGNVWQRTATLLTNGAPPKVTGLTAAPGDGRVTLNWTASTATDLDHYEVWMGTTSGSEANLNVSGLTANSYIKTGLTNDNDYYFKVYAVDTDGNRSPASDEVTCSPTLTPGVNRPSTPASFNAVASLNTAVLTWTASFQDGTSTLGGYYIYRDGSTTAFASVAAGATTWTDTIGWSTTHTYYVRAYNAAGRRSYSTSTVSVTTSAAPTYTLTVKFSVSSGNPTGSAKVVQTDVVPNVTSGPTSLNKNSSAVFAGRPYGVYTVSVTVNGVTKTLDVNPLSTSRTVTLAF
jgi:prepilin-type N-terminal cleavage/methylation domain-containing protein